jgi:phosphomethylpyrimidine synthase
MSSKIAAHCIDILRFKDEFEKDRKLSVYRAHRNWKKLFPLVMDEAKARRYRNASMRTAKICVLCAVIFVL